MNRSVFINLGLFLVAFVIAFLLLRDDLDLDATNEQAQATTNKYLELNSQQQTCVRDAGGYLVPVADYQRIVSLSTSVDAFLLKSVGIDRIHAYCSYSKSKPYGTAFIDKQSFPDAKNIEALIQAKSDLIIMPSMSGDLSVVNRLREAGLNVFNIGAMSGQKSFTHYCMQLGHLCNVAKKSAAIVGAYKQQMNSIAQGRAADKRLRGLYVSVFNDQCYGGVQGSGYHDILLAAGLRDAADDATWTWSSAWPQLSVEQIIQLDPDVLILPSGTRDNLLAIEGLKELRAIKRDKIYEVEGSLIHDAGFLMYDAATALHQAVYGH